MNKGDFRFNLKSLKVKCSGKTVGTLAAASNGRIAFSYDEEWLKDGFSISPFSLPLENKVFVPKNNNNNIKGYRVREGLTPEYIVLDASLILNVECVTQANSPNFPWGLIHFLMMYMKND